MDYKELIIELIKRIEDKEIIYAIYQIIQKIYSKR